MQRAFAVTVVDLVQRHHQAGAGRVYRVVLLQIKLVLHASCRLQLQQHHARFGQRVAGLIDRAYAGHRSGHQRRRVRRWPAQRHHHAFAESRPGPERASVGEHKQLAGVAVLHPQLFSGTGGKLAHGFDQRRQRGDGLPKRPSAGNLLLRWGLVFQVYTGHALQLTYRALQHHAPPAAHGGRVHANQIDNCFDSAFHQGRTNASAYAPHLIHQGGCQDFGQQRGGQRAQVADLGQLWWVDAGLALGRLGHMVGQLGQRFGAAHADAGG